MYESDTMGIRSAHSVVLPAHVLNTDPTIPIYDIFPSAHNGLFSSENKKKKSEKKTRPAQAERAHRISANADDILLRLLGNTELSPSSIGMMNDLGIGVNQPSMGVNSPPLREQVLSPPFVFHLMATPPLLREHIFGALFQTASAAGEHWVPEVSVASGAHAPSPSHHMTESALVYIASGMYIRTFRRLTQSGRVLVVQACCLAVYTACTSGPPGIRIWQCSLMYKLYRCDLLWRRKPAYTQMNLLTT